MRWRLDDLWCFYFEDGAVDEVRHISQSDVLIKSKRGLVVSFDCDIADRVMQFSANGKEEICIGLLWVDSDPMLAFGAADTDDDWVIHYEIRALGSFYNNNKGAYSFWFLSTEVLAFWWVF